MLAVSFSRRLAVVGGVMLPLLETARRWREWPGPVNTWIPWADDYLLGAILLAAAWLSRSRTGHVGILGGLGIRPASWLSAAWGFACGCGFGSTLAQLQLVIHPDPGGYGEPSGLGHGWVVLAKAALVSVGLLGLFASMRIEPPRTTPHQ